MVYRKLGNTGIKVSAFGFGSMNFGLVNDLKQATELVKIAVENGINFFDNAETYGSGKAEEIIGQAIKDLGYNRSDLVLTTKIFYGRGEVRKVMGPNATGLSRKHIIEGLKASLAAMQTDYVDVVLAHRYDANTPLEETVRAFNWVIDQGLAFHWGTSEWTVQQVEEAWEVANKLNLVGPICEQPQYNLLAREKVEKEFLPLYKTYGTGLTTWGPLASGVLTGKYSGGKVPEGSRLTTSLFQQYKGYLLTEDKLAKIDSLKPLAEELGCSMAQLCLAWTYKNEHVSTIMLGASKPEQLLDCLKAVQYVDKLTPEVLAKIESIMQTKPK
ncbi:hypothetical protein WJX72_001292 [[Myrmecia] bisecta]|uniref:NADP-dependent oxidoreductase domain-containing protein n=1 Tax=[Myrmecia] bisecta TaxID=41462 RepID=A0AAW1Q5X5_9CHLO